jgi:hypothetical protein
MRHLVAVLVCALVVLGTARQAAHAQFTTPATAPNFETEPFSRSELLRGKRITQPECAALPGGVWVAVDQQGECIRYYHSAAGGSGPEAVVLVSSEVASTNARGNSSLTTSTSSSARPRCRIKACAGLAVYECPTFT